MKKTAPTANTIDIAAKSVKYGNPAEARQFCDRVLLVSEKGIHTSWLLANCDLKQLAKAADMMLNSSLIPAFLLESARTIQPDSKFWRSKQADHFRDISAQQIILEVIPALRDGSEGWANSHGADAFGRLFKEAIKAELRQTTQDKAKLRQTTQDVEQHIDFMSVQLECRLIQLRDINYSADGGPRSSCNRRRPEQVGRLALQQAIDEFRDELRKESRTPSKAAAASGKSSKTPSSKSNKSRSGKAATSKNATA